MSFYLWLPVICIFPSFFAIDDICSFSTSNATALVSLMLLSNRFSSSSYLKLQIRSVYFVTQQFSVESKEWKKYTTKSPTSWKLKSRHIYCCWGGWTGKKLEKTKYKSARIVFQFVPSTIKIVGSMWAIFWCSASIQQPVLALSLSRSLGGIFYALRLLLPLLLLIKEPYKLVAGFFCVRSPVMWIAVMYELASLLHSCLCRHIAYGGSNNTHLNKLHSTENDNGNNNHGAQRYTKKNEQRTGKKQVKERTNDRSH